ncbi:MAG: MlaD family protein [Myxococcaceae bacterium]
MSATTKIGLLLIAALVVGAILILRIEDIHLFSPEGVPHKVLVEDVKGLEKKAAVRVSGVRVGSVTDLRLAKQGVEITVMLSSGVELRKGAEAMIVSRGLLGDKELELLPGPPDAAPLDPGSQIPEKRIVSSVEEVVTIAGEISQDVKAVTGGLKDAVGDPEGERRLEVILENLTRLTEQLTRLLERQDGNLEASLENAAAISVSLKSAAENLQAITQKVNEGEGTMGQLITSPETGENLNQALTSVTALTDGARKISALRFGFGLRGEYLVAPSKPKGYFTLDVIPSERTFLRFEAVTQPFGYRSSRTTVTSVEGSAGAALVATPGSTTTTVRQEEFTDAFAVSAMLGFRFRPLVLRAGLLESRGGLGADLFFLGDRLKLTADAWDFNREGYLPHTKLQGLVSVYRGIYLVGGWDDFLNQDHDAASFYFGAGVLLDSGDD